jgi:dTDP-4-amino-4,6-dideoxy-D-galactose acyltransferase
VDIRITLAARAANGNAACDGVRPAELRDLPRLREIAARSHRDSRFYADGNFPREACDRLYAVWVERSMLDREFAGAVFVTENEDGEADGYITCASREEAGGEIGLVAVDAAARRQGKGRRLLARAGRWFADRGSERISVVTQGSNVAALRLYERYGFTADRVELWFHWWRPRAARLPA